MDQTTQTATAPTRTCIDCRQAHTGPDAFRCPTCWRRQPRAYRRFTAQVSAELTAYLAEARATASKTN